MNEYDYRFMHLETQTGRINGGKQKKMNLIQRCHHLDLAFPDTPPLLLGIPVTHAENVRVSCIFFFLKKNAH